MNIVVDEEFEAQLNMFNYEEDSFMMNVNGAVAAIVSNVALDELDTKGVGWKEGSKNIPRRRIPVEEIFAKLGQRFIRKCYRMSEESFWKLHQMLKPYIRENKERSHGGATPNGDVPSEARLSMALRWFAGGEAADIFLNHGVGYGEVYTSVWRITDAINLCPSLQIRFPTDHQEQQEIADAFKKKSKVARFGGCVGCIDGMLVWTNKPSKRNLEAVGIGPKKFFCGRKKKFGIMLQAVCDSKRRFIDVAVGHPGATSDYLNFVTTLLASTFSIYQGKQMRVRCNPIRKSS